MINFHPSFNISQNNVNIKDYTPQKISQEFEAIFIYFLLKEMRKTLPNEGGLFPLSRSEEIFREMFDEQLSQEIAKAGGIGISQLYEKFIKSEKE